MNGPGPSRRRGVRPVRPLRPVACVVAVVAIWWLVGHNSGAGWVQMVGVALAATLAVGLFGPAVILWRSVVSLERAPADGTARLPVELVVRSSVRVRLRPVEPPGPEVLVGPVRRRRLGARAGPAPGDEVTLLPERRGVHTSLLVDVASAAPFALLWWTRSVALPLPAPLHIAPRLGPAFTVPPRQDDSRGEGRERTPASVGETRGVRPYHAGDSRRWLHWPATAHTGRFMVREMEASTAEPMTVTVTLPADRDAAERVAERALGTVTLLLDQSIPVILETWERDGPVASAVGDRRQAGRRLARAVPGGVGRLGDRPEVEVS